MKTTDSRRKSLAIEIKHNSRIIDHPEKTWGYASTAGILRADRRAALMIHYGRIEHGSRALEVGCGVGGITNRIQNTGADIIASELYIDFVQDARRRIPEKTHINYLVSDTQELPLVSESLDVVFGNSILHHLDISSALKEFWRILKPGGRIVFTEPNMLNPQIALQKNWGWLKKRLGDTPGETAFLASRTTGMLYAHGYSEVVIFPFDFLHPSTPVRLISYVVKISQILEKIPIVRHIAGSLLISGKKEK